MSNGLTVELAELIALRRDARASYTLHTSAARLGSHRSPIRARGMDFSETRHYQAGDEIRHMEWRATARSGKPHIKLYQEERERAVVLLVDFNPSMLFGTRLAFKSVVAARLSALLAWMVMSQGDRIGAVLFSANEHSEFMPKSREAGVLALLSALCHYTKQTQSMQFAKPRRFSEALLRLHRVVRPGSMVVCVSDFYHMDEETETHFKRLRLHNDLLAYHVCDLIELGPPPPGEYPISNGQDVLQLDLQTRTQQAAYQHECQERLLLLQNRLQRLGIPYTQVTSLSALPLLLRQTFPRRRHD
jgi:uncharacterized protein (DUF58 family)